MTMHRIGFISIGSAAVMLTTLIVSGCGKKGQDSESGSDQTGGAVPILEQPMVASVGVGGPPRGSRNNRSAKDTPRPADAIDAPEVPSDLKIPESALELAYRPVSESGVRYESMVIRELQDKDGIFSRKDFLELSLAGQAESEGDEVNAHIETERVYVRYEGPRGSTEFDTINAIAYSGDLAKALTPTLQTLVDERIAVALDQRGQLVTVTLPASFEDEVGANPDVVQYGFAEQYVREIAWQLAVPLPGEPVSVGEQWESNAGWSRFGPEIKLHSKYRLEGVMDRAGSECAVISFETSISGTTDQETSFKDMAYSLTGVAYVDCESGQLVYMTNEANGETTFEIEEDELVTFPIRFRTRVERISS